MKQEVDAKQLLIQQHFLRAKYKNKEDSGSDLGFTTQQERKANKQIL